MFFDGGLIKRIQLFCDNLGQFAADTEFWNARLQELLPRQEQNSIAAIDAQYSKSMTMAKSAYDAVLAKATRGINDIEQSGDLLFAPWNDSRWLEWTPTLGDGANRFIRIGELVEFGQWHKLTMPALLHIIGGQSLLLKVPGVEKPGAVQLVQSLLLRLLLAIPPGKLRFLFIDPVGLGQNVAPFMHLADFDDAYITGKAWTESQHIEQRLADMTEHMENVIQKYLRNQFSSIEDYNIQAGKVAEPYRTLVVMDFPVNFSDAAARRLVSIAQNGPRCGVYTVVLNDTTKPLPYGFNIADLERFATVLFSDKGHLVWQDNDLKDCQLKPDSPPGVELFDKLVKVVGETARESNKVEVPFERIALPRAQWWTGNSQIELRVSLGPVGARKIQYLDLGKGTAQHVLVAGKTGSGKSTLLHTLITNIALTYSPIEVELYLIDFKKGVEFKTYATHQLPHARVIAIESEREFGLSVLQGLDTELKRRGDLFRAIGVDSLTDYRQKSGKPMPRVLLLVDEFQEFFIEDDATASQSAQILDRLVRQGRAFGIHILLGSQTLAGAYTLARSTIDQMAVRIALLCSEADSRLILADDNPAARLLSRPGEAIYNASNGMVEGNNRFQVAWLPEDKHENYLKHVRALVNDHKYQSLHTQIVFEGNVPAEVQKNHALHDLLMSPALPTPPRVLCAWVGEPVAIRESVSANFRRQSGSNLLIVGQNDEAALAIMAIALISLAAQVGSTIAGKKNKTECSFYILDFGTADLPSADLFKSLESQISRPIIVGHRRDLPGMVNDLATEVQCRLDADKTDAPPKFLFLYGLQRARDLRQEESFGLSSFDSPQPVAPNPARQFSTVLREGPDVGVHTLVWCDTLTNLNRNLDRQSLREFAMRVVFQMGAEDSANLIDSPAASKLGAHRALFYSEDEGRLEKFRPYAIPVQQWLDWAGQQLKKKSR